MSTIKPWIVLHICDKHCRNVLFLHAVYSVLHLLLSSSSSPWQCLRAWNCSESSSRVNFHAALVLLSECNEGEYERKTHLSCETPTPPPLPPLDHLSFGQPLYWCVIYMRDHLSFDPNKHDHKKKKKREGEEWQAAKRKKKNECCQQPHLWAPCSFCLVLADASATCSPASPDKRVVIDGQVDAAVCQYEIQSKKKRTMDSAEWDRPRSASGIYVYVCWYICAYSFVCRSAKPHGPLWQCLHEREREGAREEWEQERENHLTPQLSWGRGCCKLHIKTQIAFRRVSRCQMILDACHEETTTTISQGGK